MADGLALRAGHHNLPDFGRFSFILINIIAEKMGMAAPAVKAPATGHHVLFFVRNSIGITSVISYLNSRSVKSWTASTLEDAQAKIKNNRIGLVFLSVNLKNVSVGAIVESLKKEPNLSIVIFAEETSRKIEGDIARLKTPNKIVPPNQNAKFFDAIQKNLGGGPKFSKVGANDLDNHLPPKVEPAFAADVPKGGRWLKISPDDRVKSPFTYKYVPPRHMAVTRIRYFYVGPKPPEPANEGAGWAGDEAGQFYVSGKVMEVVEEESYPAPMEQSERALEELPSDFPEDLKNALESDAQLPEPTKNWHSRQSNGFSRISQQLMESWNAWLSQFGGSADNPGILQRLAGLFSSPLKPVSYREPDGVVEQELSVVVPESVMRPHFEQPLEDDRVVHKLAITYVAIGDMKGFIFADLFDFSPPSWWAFLKIVESMKKRLDSQGMGVEVILKPCVVEVEALPIVSISKANSIYLVQVSAAALKIIAGFIQVDDLPAPGETEDRDRLSIEPRVLEAGAILPFDLYLHMPANGKSLRYLKRGGQVPEKSLEKLKSETTTRLGIETSSLERYYGYALSKALRLKLRR